MITLAAAANQGKQYDDDAVQAAFAELDGAKIGFGIGVFITGMICNAVAIYGASNFNKIAIIIGGVWFVFEVVRSFVYLDIAGAAMAAFFCYPHAVFYYEIKNGIMSRETYPEERNCCDCCN
jgi:hypothetical protein